MTPAEPWATNLGHDRAPADRVDRVASQASARRARQHVTLRTAAAAGLAALALMATPARTAAQEAPASDDAPAAPADESPLTGEEITPQLQAAVEQGLAFLAQQQAADGSIGGGMGQASTGITSLSAIAFMAAGNLPGRGQYGEQVSRALRYVMDNGQPSGLLASEDSHGVMYSHGFATLFLAEVYGMTGDEEVKERLQDAVALITRAQNAEGGWRYTPAPLDADVSVTICQVMALRAARDAGIKVDRNVIDRAIEYVRKCQNPDGGFNYMLTGGGSMFPRSAAGVAALFYAGVYEGPEIEKGLAYIDQFRPGQPNAARAGAHYYYGQYYAVQTMFLAGGEWWRRWFPAVRDELLDRQNRGTGSWSGDFNDEYATAMALIVLQMPNRYLPVFSGKGPGS